jgi:hypothetical protein
VKFWRVEEPVIRRVPSWAMAANKFVLEAVVAKEFVLVALVVVEFPVMLRLPVKVEEALVKIMLDVVAETPAEG